MRQIDDELGSVPRSTTGHATGLSDRRRRRAACFAGSREIAPMVLAMSPLGLAIGAVAGESPIHPLLGWAVSPLVFAGSAQLLVLGLLSAGAAGPVVIVSALAVNARVAVFSAALSRHLGAQPRSRRLAMASVLVDHVAVACIARFDRGDLDDAEREAYYWGAAGTTFVAWVALHTIGMVAAVSLPPSLALGEAAILVYVGLLARATRGVAGSIAAVTGGVLAVGLSGLPMRGSVLAATLIGAAAAAAVEARTARGASS